MGHHRPRAESIVCRSVTGDRPLNRTSASVAGCRAVRRTAAPADAHAAGWGSAVCGGRDADCPSAPHRGQAPWCPRDGVAGWSWNAGGTQDAGDAGTLRCHQLLPPPLEGRPRATGADDVPRETFCGAASSGDWESPSSRKASNALGEAMPLCRAARFPAGVTTA